jgi:hypothetical protein
MFVQLPAFVHGFEAQTSTTGASEILVFVGSVVVVAAADADDDDEGDDDDSDAVDSVTGEVVSVVFGPVLVAGSVAAAEVTVDNGVMIESSSSPSSPDPSTIMVVELDVIAPAVVANVEDVLGGMLHRLPV